MALRRFVGRFFATLVVLLSSLLVATSARAESDSDSEPGARPIRYASVELNPLVLLVHRVSGQVQVGVIGPVSLVASASRLSLDDSLHYSEYDETVFGAPSLSGWLFEIGPRVALPLGTSRVYVWMQPSFLADRLEQGPELSCSGGGSGSCQRVGGATSIRRTGVALDVGFHFRIGAGFYATTGFGISHKSAANVDEGSSNSPIAAPPLYSGGATNLRLLASLGFGF